MDAQTEILEQRLKSLLGQLQAECGVFERIVYKNKNQHRRCSYFQYLLRVRRDLRLLQSAKLEEVLESCFQVISGKKPKQKVHLLESLKRRRCDTGKYNFMERLLGAARLLSQMVEPILRAAIEISILLARSFFMGFSVLILALLARLRVLVQQILLDVVSVFNIVSPLSLRKQAVKINQEGIEIFREFYPTNEEYVTLDCVWETDKFVLLESMQKGEIQSQEGDVEVVSAEKSAIRYESIKSFLGEDELTPEKTNQDYAAIKKSTYKREDKAELLAGPSIETDNKDQIEGYANAANPSVAALTPEKDLLGETATTCSSLSSNPLNLKSGARKVAFVSVKRPALSASSATDFQRGAIDEDNVKKKDRFYALLTGGNPKDNLF